MSYYQYQSRGRYGARQQSNRTANKSRQPKKAYIHPSRFVQSATPVAASTYLPVNKFSDFGLNQVIQTNLSQMGYSEPSPIQDQTIPAGLLGKDVVGIANTGTGKTAAFAIPLLNRLMADAGSQAI